MRMARVIAPSTTAVEHRRGAPRSVLVVQGAVDHRLLLLPSLCVLAACGAPPAAESGSTLVPPEPSAGCRPGTLSAAVGERHEVAGRSYLFDAPAAPADRPLPVVLAFHGFRSDASDLRAGIGFAQLAGNQGIAVVYPEGHDGVELLGMTGVGWDLRPDQTTDRDFVRTVLDRLDAERCIDRRRIYATGMSNGGFLANLLGCQLSDRLAAVAPVAGALDLGSCTPARPIPILLLYGSADTVVSPELVERGVAWWAKRNGCTASAPSEGCTRWTGCTADVVACEGSQPHRWPRDATDRIWQFFSAHVRP
jgi:polyhydroxybutyrate depolymerase